MDVPGYHVKKFEPRFPIGFLCQAFPGQRLYPRAAAGAVKSLIDTLLVFFAKLSFF